MNSMADFAEEFAGIMWTVLKGADMDKTADNMVEFLARHTDLTDEEKKHFMQGIGRLVVKDIGRLELECLIILSYNRAIYERKVHRSQGN